MLLRKLLLTSAAVFACTAGARANTFSLNGSLGATPTFTINSGGVTATYTSPTGNGFAVQNTSGLLTFNTALLDNNFFGTDPLTITFSSPITGSLVIPFAILDAYSTTDIFSIMTDTGQTASFTGIPDGLTLGEPEGLAAISLVAPVHSITLTGTSAFAIGDVSAVTPEPASIALFSTGLAGVAALRRRRTV